MALGVNDRDEVVGTYTIGSGGTATMHGFTWKPGQGFSTVDDPQGIGTTTINGVNDAGNLVGFYVDGAGNTDGLLATPLHKTTLQLHLLTTATAWPRCRGHRHRHQGANAVPAHRVRPDPGVLAHRALLHGNVDRHPSLPADRGRPARPRQLHVEQRLTGSSSR